MEKKEALKIVPRKKKNKKNWEMQNLHHKVSPLVYEVSAILFNFWAFQLYLQVVYTYIQTNNSRRETNWLSIHQLF